MMIKKSVFSKRSYNLLAFFILVGMVLMAQSKAVAASSPIDLLAKRLSKWHTMEANFEQRALNAKHVVGPVIKGHMVLQRPNRFRWAPDSDEYQLIVSDRQYLWVYDKAMEQVIKRKVNALHQANPAALLSGSVQVLKQQFTVQKRYVSHGGNVYFFLKSKQGDNGLLKQLILNFSGEKLVEMRIVDNLGQTSQLYFTHIRLNQPIQGHPFHFLPPKGVDVIQE